jgi:L-threonylcarbamoyladenylate synthase
MPSSAPRTVSDVIIKPSTENLNGVADLIAQGGIIAFRTDTFYGLGADPFNQVAIEKIKTLKGREEGKPILVLISDLEQLDRLIPKRSASFDLLARKFWPGAITLIGSAHDALSPELTAGTKTVGVRLPDDARVRTLVRSCGGALTATSANPSDQSPAMTAADAENYFGDRIDAILDGGTAKTDQPSTVVNAIGDDVKLIREGMVAWKQIQDALNQS